MTVNEIGFIQGETRWLCCEREERGVYKCVDGETEIYEGEQYLEHDEEILCTDCAKQRLEDSFQRA